jgi:hypothetical protein
VKTLELLALMEKGEMGNCEVSDTADELWDEVSDECQAILGIQDRKKLRYLCYSIK